MADINQRDVIKHHMRTIQDAKSKGHKELALSVCNYLTAELVYGVNGHSMEARQKVANVIAFLMREPCRRRQPYNEPDDNCGHEWAGHHLLRDRTIYETKNDSDDTIGSLVKSGRIISYNRNDGVGEILLDSGGRIRFNTSSFDSGIPDRPPQDGDCVDVRLSDKPGSKIPLYVRLRNLAKDTIDTVFVSVDTHESFEGDTEIWAKPPVKISIESQRYIDPIGTEDVPLVSVCIDDKANIEINGQDIFGELERERFERMRLEELINNPHTDGFLEAVRLEAAHQQERWGSGHDSGKAAPDWFWLLGYLAGKAIESWKRDDTEKLLHHIVTTAAACMNWHANASGKNRSMRPGIDPQ